MVKFDVKHDPVVIFTPSFYLDPQNYDFCGFLMKKSTILNFAKNLVYLGIFWGLINIIRVKKFKKHHVTGDPVEGQGVEE